MAWTQTATLGMGNPERERIVAARTASVRGKSGSGYSSKTSGSAAAPVATTGGTPASVTAPFERALAELSGASSDMEKTYQSGKRRTMSNIAMQHVNAGMANVLNMPAAELAYEEAVRPGMNVQLAQSRAGVLQNLGGAAANMYGTQVGAQTALQTAQMGSDTSMATAGMQFASNRANQALQRYIADLSAKTLSQNNSPVPTLSAPSA